MNEAQITGSSVAHLGLNFWRQLVAKDTSYYFRSDNALLLCLEDDGRLLHHFFLNQNGLSGSSIVMWACVTLAKGIGASTLVRIQTHPAYEADPLQINSSVTKVLYKATNFYDLHLTEVVLPHISPIF